MNSKVTGEGDEGVKKSIAIFGYKQQLLSIDMKTKVVQHVPRIIFKVFKVLKFSSFQVFKFFKFSITFLVPSACLTFRHFFGIGRILVNILDGSNIVRIFIGGRLLSHFVKPVTERRTAHSSPIFW